MHASWAAKCGWRCFDTVSTASASLTPWTICPTPHPLACSTRKAVPSSVFSSVWLAAAVRSNVTEAGRGCCHRALKARSMAMLEPEPWCGAAAIVPSMVSLRWALSLWLDPGASEVGYGATASESG
eukprot:3255922-Rhodomonas_salina.1